MRRWGFLLVCLAVLVGSPATADFPDGFNHPEVDWIEFETDHFVIVYNEGLEETAQLGAEILESIHEEACDFLNTRPAAKTTVVFTDYDDVGANNFARRLQHVIYLSNPVMNQGRVATEQWLTHLLRHEYIHVINGWGLRRAAPVLGGLYEWTGMELQPQWFTEGICEYFAGEYPSEPVPYVLQAAVENELLHGAKMAIREARFDIIETGTVYRQGLSMCIDMAERYGEDIFARIVDQYGTTPQFDVAFLIETGDTVDAFYNKWRNGVEALAAEIPEQTGLEAAATPLPTPLVAALAARPSPNGQLVAVFGIEDWEQPIPGIYLMRPDGSGWTKIAAECDLFDSARFTWSPDSQYVLYVARVRDRTGAVRNAFFVYDIFRRRSNRLDTGDMRVFEPSWSPDGTRIAFVTYIDEKALLATMDRNGGDVRLVTESLEGNAFSPSWSPTGDRLAFSYVTPEGSDIAVIGIDGSGFQQLTSDPWPDQFPAWAPDGERIAFMSYREVDAGEAAEDAPTAAVTGEAEGIAGTRNNIYLIDPDGGEPQRVTGALVGGAFYPAWEPGGEALLFSHFRIRVATIQRLDGLALPPADETAAAPGPAGAPAEAAPAAEPEPAVDGTTVVDRPVEPSAVASVTSEGEDTVRLAARSLSIELAGPARPAEAVQGEANGPVVSPTSEGVLQRTEARPYRSLARINSYVYRPYTDDDPLGDVIGLRWRMADPLQMHNFHAELNYGIGSERVGAEAGYLNDQTDWRLGFNVFRRVPPLRVDRGVLVADEATGVELLAVRPLALFRDAFTRDTLTFGLEFADRDPFATAGGAIIPPPQQAFVAGPSVELERIEILPQSGEQVIRGKFTRADDLFGSDISFNKLDLFYLRRFFVPDPEHTVGLASALTYFNGEDFSRNEIEQAVFIGQLRYDWRVADELFSRVTWPYLHIGPVYFSPSYELRELISGTSVGTDVRDRVRLQFTNRGYISRHFTYDLVAGPEFTIGGGDDTDFVVQLLFGWRELPF